MSAVSVWPATAGTVTASLPRGAATIAMDGVARPCQHRPGPVREADGREVTGPELFWLAGMSALIGPMAAAGADCRGRRRGAGHGTGADFFNNLTRLRSGKGDFAGVATVFEDFEKKTYEGWTLTGDGLWQRPLRTGRPGQQPVSGFAGHGLVNTFVGGDGPQGTATSSRSASNAATSGS